MSHMSQAIQHDSNGTVSLKKACYSYELLRASLHRVTEIYCYQEVLRHMSDKQIEMVQCTRQIHLM